MIGQAYGWLCPQWRMTEACGMRAETLAVLGAYRRTILVGCYDLTMPDITYAGGHEKFRRLACLEQNAGIDIAQTTQNGPDLLPLVVQFG
jgi:hypothetical protein